MSNGIAYPDVLSNVDMPGRSAPAAASGSRLNITVCDPVKQDQGINAYITYKVRTSSSSWPWSSFAVAVVEFREVVVMVVSNRCWCVLLLLLLCK